MPSQFGHNQVDAYSHEKGYPSHAGGLSGDHYAKADYFDSSRDREILDRQGKHDDGAFHLNYKQLSRLRRTDRRDQRGGILASKSVSSEL